MESLLSNLVDNLAKGIHKIKWKHRHECETCEVKYKHCTKNEVSIHNFFNSFLRIWSHLLKKSLMEKITFCPVKDCEGCFEYANVKDDLLEYKCLYCNKNYQKSLMKT